jgi:hypothetical protein
MRVLLEAFPRPEVEFSLYTLGFVFDFFLAGIYFGDFSKLFIKFEKEFGVL